MPSWALPTRQGLISPSGAVRLARSCRHDVAEVYGEGGMGMLVGGVVVRSKCVTPQHDAGAALRRPLESLPWRSTFASKFAISVKCKSEVARPSGSAPATPMEVWCRARREPAKERWLAAPSRTRAISVRRPLRMSWAIDGRFECRRADWGWCSSLGAGSASISSSDTLSPSDARLASVSLTAPSCRSSRCGSRVPGRPAPPRRRA